MRSREIIGLLLLISALVQVCVFLWVDSTFHAKFGTAISPAFLRQVAQQHFFEMHYGWAGIVGCLSASGWMLQQARRGGGRPGLSADVPTAPLDPMVWPPPPNRPAA